MSRRGTALPESARAELRKFIAEKASEGVKLTEIAKQWGEARPALKVSPQAIQYHKSRMVDELLLDAREFIDVATAETLRELYLVASARASDASSWSDADGISFVPSTELSSVADAGVKSVEVVETTTTGEDGVEAKTTRRRIVMHDKAAAAMGLLKMLHGKADANRTKKLIEILRTRGDVEGLEMVASGADPVDAVLKMEKRSKGNG